jgi:hypothetical protein
MFGLDEYAKKKAKEIEAKLARTIMLVQVFVFVAVASVGLLIGSFFLESVELTEIGVVLVIAAAAAVMVGSRLWRIYNEIKQEALSFVEDQKRKISGTQK